MFPCPYLVSDGTIYRGMAIVGVEGVSVLPTNCLALCGGFAGIAIVFDLMRDFLPHKYGRLVPLPMCMALPFYLGAWLAVDMIIGGENCVCDCLEEKGNGVWCCTGVRARSLPLALLPCSHGRC